MPRLFLIDQATGYIFADTADLRGFNYVEPIEAAAIAAANSLDTELGNPNQTYVFERKKPNGAQQGYRVYSDRSGSDLVTTVWNGEDPEVIAIIEEQGEYEGFISLQE